MEIPELQEQVAAEGRVQMAFCGIVKQYGNPYQPYIILLFFYNMDMFLIECWVVWHHLAICQVNPFYRNLLELFKGIFLFFFSFSWKVLLWV